MEALTISNWIAIVALAGTLLLGAAGIIATIVSFIWRLSVKVELNSERLSSEIQGMRHDICAFADAQKFQQKKRDTQIKEMHDKIDNTGTELARVQGQLNEIVNRRQ